MQGKVYKNKLSNNMKKIEKHTTFMSGMDKIYSQLIKLGENMQIQLKVSHKNDKMHLQ